MVELPASPSRGTINELSKNKLRPFDNHRVCSTVHAESTDASLEDMSLEELLNVDLVVTSASKLEQTVDEAPALVAVISRSELENFGFRTVAEALNGLPGLFVIDNLVSPEVAIRGIHGGTESWSRVLKVMVDGFPAMFYDTAGSFLGPELIPIEAVERIEVIRGPASALYGANAFLGVINVVTRDSAPSQTPGETKVESKLTSILSQQSSAAAGGSAGGYLSVRGGDSTAYQLSLAATVNRIDRSGLTVPTGSPNAADYIGEESENDLSHPRSIYGRLNIRNDSFGTMEFFALEQQIDAIDEFSSLSILSHQNRRAKRNRIIAARYTQSFLDDTFELRAAGQWNQGTTLPVDTIDTGDPLVILSQNRTNQTVQGSLELSYLWKEISFLLGAETISSKTDQVEVFQTNRDARSATTLRTTAEAVSIENQAVYTQVYGAIFEDLRAIGGLRYDVISQGGNHQTGRVGLVWTPSADWTLKLLGGRSFVSPAPEQLGAAPMGKGTTKGNPNLQNQLGITGELAINYRWSSALSLQLSSYITRIENRVEFIDDGFNLRAENINRSRSLGAEFQADFSDKFFFGRIFGSLQHTQMFDPETPLTWWRTVYPSNSEESWLSSLAPSYPWAHGGAELGLKIPDYYLQASTLIRVVGSQKSSVSNIRKNGEAYYLDSYVVGDLWLRTQEIEVAGLPIELGFRIKNILDSQYSYAGSLGIDIPNRGRRFSLILSIGN